jgi:hypothetical protein
MKKLGIVLLLTLMVSVGMAFANPVEDLQTVAESSHYVGSFIGGGYEAVKDYEFQSETLQRAQRVGKDIGDAVVDVYEWAKE